MRNKKKSSFRESVVKTLALASLSPYLVIFPNMLDKISLRQIEPKGLEKSVSVSGNYQPSTDFLAYARYIAANEGAKDRVYDPNPFDGKPEPTIGVGHYLDGTNSRAKFSRALPEVDYDLVYLGKQKLTRDQIERLFAEDLKEHVEKTKGFFPDFDSYPIYLRQALVDGVYRGCLSGSPKTRKLINEGMFDLAAKEYLRNDEYKTAGQRGMAGVKRRMEKNQRAILKYSSERRI